MNQAHVPLKWRYKLFSKAFKTATVLDGLHIIKLDGKKDTRYKHWCGSNPKFAKHLRTWGEAGTVSLKSKSTPKIADRGIQCMMVGYSTNHTGDCYDMWDPSTGGIHQTRDIIWLRRMYFPPIEAVPELAPSGGDIIVDTNLERSTLEVGEGEPSDDYEVETVPEDDGASDDVEEEAERNDDEIPELQPRTKSGRKVRMPERLIEEMNAAANDYEIALTPAEERYYATMRELGEFGLVGAGIGGGFVNTSELHVMKFNEAMLTGDKKEWNKAVEKEHGRMVDHKAWIAKDRGKIPVNAKVLTNTWAMKKKASGTFRARLNARGFEQIPGVHYDKTQISSPVVNEITIRMVLILICMARWHAMLLDVQGAFLCGVFARGEQIYMEIPQGFEKYYPSNAVLLLLKTIYGLKQAALAFWRELLKALMSMRFGRSKADPCLYFRWTAFGLILWLSWVDDCLVAGKKNGVYEAKAAMMDRFDCDDIGELKEYIGCKIDYDKEEGSMKITQPVMIQSFEDEFKLPEGKASNTPAIPGSVMTEGEEKDQVGTDEQSTYRSGLGKLLYMMRWSRPEIQNAVRELSRHAGKALRSHLMAMFRVMKYCGSTPDRGLYLKPSKEWDGSPKMLFEIVGMSDSDWAKDPDTRRSVSGWSTFLFDAPVSMKSKMMPIVALSVTEAELFAATCCAQDMLFEMRILESMGLKVKKPMILKVDNKGAKDLCDNWSVGGRTRHVEVKQLFLRELKEAGLIDTNWIPGEDMTSDIFTKNLQGPLFDKHGAKFLGVDKYMTKLKGE
jgi:hypothetical protein